MIDFDEAGDLDAERRNRMGPLDDELGFDLADMAGNLAQTRRRQIGYLRDRAGVERQLNVGVESGRLDPNYAFNRSQRQQANQYQPQFDTPYRRDGATPRTELPKYDDFWSNQFAQQAASRRANSAYYGARDAARREDVLGGWY